MREFPANNTVQCPHSGICPRPHQRGVEPQRAGDEKGARQVKILGNNHGRVHPENAFCPVYAVVSVKPGVIQEDILHRNAAEFSIAAHVVHFVVAAAPF